jgi:RNA polymerase sigma-70 factor (ECF subfamily)
VSDLEAARGGDDAAFARLIAPFRRELRAHCYRMAGTIHDADDLLQESLVRAWRGLASFEGRASLRTWLYKVTTHACLDKLDTASERAARAAHELVEPCPPELYTDISPEARISARESIALAFMVALQLLTAKQRAVLILRDVIGMEASECAELLDLTVAAVNSALQRAREAVGDSSAAVPARDPDRDAVVARYLNAWERADSSALIGLLRDDARLAMPPMPETYVGAAAIGAAIGEMVFAPAGAGAFTFVAIEASGEPALALYERGDDGRFHARAIQFIQTRDGLVADILAFVDPSLFGRLGVPTSIAL